MCDESHRTCNCVGKSSYQSVQQTLDELDFSRGIWTAALDGSLEEATTFIERKGVHPDSVDSSGYTALVIYLLNKYLILSVKAFRDTQTCAFNLQISILAHKLAVWPISFGKGSNCPHLYKKLGQTMLCQ